MLRRVETILNDNHLNYSTVNSSQLNQMTDIPDPGISSADFSGGILLISATA